MISAIGSIDEAGPVHHRAIARIDAVLVKVEPALPCDQVAHLNKP